MSKGLLSVVTGNTPGVRGAVVDQLLGLAPGAVVLVVSIQAQDTGYPIVQRCLSGTGTAVPGGALQGATGDPVVILRQDLLSLRRSWARCTSSSRSRTTALRRPITSGRSRSNQRARALSIAATISPARVSRSAGCSLRLSIARPYTG
ncbi:hypothetical protein [Streptomyces sp. NPDC004008]